MDKDKGSRDKAYQFLQNFKEAALATVDGKGNPQVSSVYCVVDAKLNLYFITRTKGRKYDNLIAHPRVAMVITDEKNLTTIQLSGDAASLEGKKTEQEILSQLWRFRFPDPQWPVPPIRLFESGFAKELAVIKVTPVEMTYANFESTPKGQYKSYFQKII